MCYTIIYQSTLLYLYYVYVYSHALLSRIVFSLHVDRKEYYVILVFDNCHVDTTLIVIDPNMYNYITYVLSKWRLLMVIQHGNCNCSCLFSMFSILFFSIIIIEKLYIIQHLFLVYYSLFCHFQPALSIGTRLIHNYFLRVCFRTTLMLTYSEHKYVNNVLPGLEIYKYIWCELYTPLIILIASIIVIHSHFSHIKVNCSGHTCNCSRNETLPNIHHVRNSMLRYKYASQFCCTQSKLCLLEVALNKCMYLYVPNYYRILFHYSMLYLDFPLRCIHLRCRPMANYNYVSTNVPHVHIVFIHIYNNG